MTIQHKGFKNKQSKLFGENKRFSGRANIIKWIDPDLLIFRKVGNKLIPCNGLAHLSLETTHIDTRFTRYKIEGYYIGTHIDRLVSLKTDNYDKMIEKLADKNLVVI